jgi:putative 4-mercaptohistidine N1-methyltranferase
VNDTKTWGWDNEFGHEQHLNVPAFKASKFLVSNAEFYDFVEAGGYQTERYWSEEGWKWAGPQKENNLRPRFWKEYDGQFKLRTLTEEISMPWDWPVEVNNHEGAAFCRWLAEKTGKPIRLPSEAEWLRVRDDEPTDIQDSAHGPAWKFAPGNVNLEYYASACPVNMFVSPSGFFDVTGNVWQHSADQIDVLPGFKTHPLYEDFTVPTVDGQHPRILGGSFFSTGTAGATRDARFGFRPHFYQHAGFRYVESSAPVNNIVIPYEQDRELCSKLQFHFNPSQAVMDFNYPDRIAAVVKDAAESILGKDISSLRTFELGCGPGKTSIKLAQMGAKESVAADQNAKTFQMVDHFLLNGPNRLRWQDMLEGERINLTEIQWQEESPASLSWVQTPDFTEIDTTKFHDMDVLVVAQPDSLSKSIDPAKFLKTLHSSVRPGGLLVLGTTYNWKSEAAAGKTGEQVTAELLSNWWEPVGTPVDVPFALQETARKFNCGNQHVTFWQRRAAPQGESAAAEAINEQAVQGQGMYEEHAVLGQYLDFHFQDGAEGNYPTACAAKCVALCEELNIPTRRALDIGGGPGRSTFELAKVFDHVDGGDYSKRFVEAAQGLARDGQIAWTSCDNLTGSTTVDRSFTLADKGLGNVAFHEMDAHALPEDLVGYDLICGFNLIDRLTDPAQALMHIKERLNVGGLLVLSSPYTWKEEHTPKDNWLGGYKFGDNDGPTTTEGLRKLLVDSGFRVAKAPEDLSFTLRTQADGRRYERTRAELSVFQRME